MATLAIHVGYDVAFTTDYSALTVCEVLNRPRAGAMPPQAPYRADEVEKETYYHVQELGRLPHGLTVAQQAAHVVKVFAAIRRQIVSEYNPHGFEPLRIPPRGLYIDATGLGRPVTEVIQQALADNEETRDVSVWPCVFVHGQRDYDQKKGTVGKTHLFARLRALWTTGRLDLPKSDPLVELLKGEIAAFDITIDRDGVETMGGKAPMHDDILTSLALACVDEPWEPGYIPFHAPGYL